MTSLILSIASLLGLLLLGEVVLWRLFMRHADVAKFPAGQHGSRTGIFHLGTLRVFAICHTLALGSWITVSLLWAW